MLFLRQNILPLDGSPTNHTPFSFPKLNGSPSRPSLNHTGSGTGFMGFGPTGFTTPIDTVLDRYGRTGTVFPPAHHNGNHFVAHNFPSAAGCPPQPHRTLPTVIHPPFVRSNSFGRSLPPLPCAKPPSPKPPLVRRRTFEDEDDQRTDWIWQEMTLIPNKQKATHKHDVTWHLWFQHQKNQEDK